MKSIKAVFQRLLKGDVLLGIASSLIASFILVALQGFLENISIFEPIFRDFYPSKALIFIGLANLFLLILNLLSSRSDYSPEPEVIFSEKITIRKINNGPRKGDFALSVKVGIKNHQSVKVFNTKMTFCYIRYSSKGHAIQRHGIEQFNCLSDYVDIVHRFDFFTQEISFLALKPIVQNRVKSNLDRISIIFSGYYDIHEPTRFVRIKDYSFDEIAFAKQTVKVLEFHSDFVPEVTWNNFNKIEYLDSDIEQRLVEDLTWILEEKDTNKE